MILETARTDNFFYLKEAIRTTLANVEKKGHKPLLSMIYFPIEGSAMIDKIYQEVKSIAPELPMVGASYGSCAFTETGYTETGYAFGVIGSKEGDLDVEITLIENEKEKTDEIKRVINEMSHRTFRKGRLQFSLLILHTAFSLDGDSLVEIIGKTGMIGRIAGGMAGDSWHLEKSYIFYNGKLIEKGILLIGLYSKVSSGVGVKHGWNPQSTELIATKVDANKVLEINGKPALDIYIEELEKNNIKVDTTNIRSLKKTLVMNEIGIYSLILDDFIVRAPLSVDGKALVLAGKVPKNARIYIMRADKESLRKSSEESVEMAIKDTKNPNQINFGLFFSCCARHENFGKDYHLEMEAIKSKIGDKKFIGFTTYGEYSKTFGSFSRFNNTTLISFVI